MNLNEKAGQLKELASQLESERTGSARLLARRVGISRSKLYDLFEDIKMIGVEVGYSKRKDSYCYTGKYRLRIEVPVKVVERDHCGNG